MFGHDFGILVHALLCGGDTKFKLPNGNGNVFFPNNRVRFARADKVVFHSSTVPQPVKHRHQRMICEGFTLGVIVGR